MADVTCPECGTVTELPAIRRAADEFCRHCDFPLFWTPSAVPAAVGGPTADTTLRRLPGAGGRQRIGSKVCPECGELNPLGNTHCIRCTADLDPRPPEPAQRLADRVVAAAARDDHVAAAVAEVEELVDLALGALEQHVLAGHADVGGAVLDVGRHVAGPDGDDPGLLEEQLAVVGADLRGVDAEPVEEVERPAHQRPARDRDRQAGGVHDCCSSAVWAMWTRWTSSAIPQAGRGAPKRPISSS